MPSSAFAYNMVGTKQNCYTESTELGKTVFDSVGQAVTVTFTDINPPTGSNIAITTAGTITLEANITYRIDMHCEAVPATGVSSTEDFTQFFVLYNTTLGQVVLPGYPMNTSGTVFVTTTQQETFIMLAGMPDGVPPNVLTQPRTWQYPQQIKNASIAIQAIDGE